MITVTPRDKKPLRIGLVGSGFMGRCHANAFRTVGGLFDLKHEPILEMLADATPELAADAARRFGFAKSTGDWRELVASRDIDLVAITAPNALHEPIAAAAITEGKAVYCEKPLSPLAGCERLTKAAQAKGVTTLVGFNYLRNPMLRFARDLIAGGELGELIGFRGIHAEDYMTDPDAPHSFRTDPHVGGGALADIGSHIVSIARFLVGPITEVVGHAQTVFEDRPERTGSVTRKPVLIDDRTSFLGLFAGGVAGTFEANWCGTGQKMQLEFEVIGAKATITYSQERMNEMRLYETGAKAAKAGFKTILSGPAHPPYSAFTPAGAHHLGFNDLKVIEVAELIAALDGGPKLFSDFREAWAVEATIDAVAKSAKTRAWEKVASTM